MANNNNSKTSLFTTLNMLSLFYSNQMTLDIWFRKYRWKIF